MCLLSSFPPASVLLIIAGLLGVADCRGRTFTTPLQYHSSSLTCNITVAKHSMCVLTDAYYWKSKLYFIADDPETILYIPHFTLPHYVSSRQDLLKVVSKRELRDLISADSNSTITEMMTLNEGITYQRLFTDNYYHTIWEGVSNLHVLACKMFGRCDYDPGSSDLLLFLDNQKANMTLHHSQLTKCISALPYEEAAAPRSTLPLRIKRLTFGLGPEAFGQHNVRGRRSLPAEPLRTSWVRRMRSCMQLPQTPGNVTQLKHHVVTIIQRPRGHRGRAISNVEEVAQWLSELLPGMDVQIARMEGKTLEEQAAVWNNSTVILSTHGAQLSNIMYMPNGSFVLEVDQWLMLKNKFYKLFVVDSVQPYLNIGHAFISPASLKSINVSRWEDLKQETNFAKLTPEQQQEWLQKPDCNHKWLDPNARCPSVWVKFYTDVHLERNEVEAGVEQARKWLRERGV